MTGPRGRGHRDERLVSTATVMLAVSTSEATGCCLHRSIQPHGASRMLSWQVSTNSSVINHIMGA